MAILTLRLLGGYEGALPSGAALRLPTRKAWALLSYLALNAGREIGRERLAALLWGERSDEQARASLRQTLYELRSGLGEEPARRLIASRDSVKFDGREIEVDARRLEQLAHEGDLPNLASLTTLYRGDLLAGLDIGEQGFDNWLAVERARLQNLACGAMERLASAQLADGDKEAAIDTAQRLVRLNPLRESAHRLLMRGLAAVGRRGEALKCFQDLVHLLQTELGVAPDPETARLREELLRDSEDDRSVRPAAEAPAPSAYPASAAAPRRAARIAWSWHRAALASLGVLAVASAAIWYFHRGGAEPPRQAAALGERPAIAVLPFENLSGDPRQDYIADGLTEDLITALSKTTQLLVIARAAVAGYKGKPAKAQSVADDLGVRYLLEGSVQKAGEDLRFTAQLIDAERGHHLWSERYDRRALQLFAVQDDIVRRILIELQVKLTDGEHARVASRGTTSLDAWLLRLQAMNELYKFTCESTRRTRQLLQAAHELDPKWARPLGGLAWSYWWEARKGWTGDREEWIRKGVALAEKAIEVDPNDTIGYMQLGNLAQLQGDHARAIALREKAVAIAPNDFQANWGLGAVLYQAGQAERGVEVLRHALRLSPRPPAALLWALAQAQLMAERYEDAIETAKRARALAPNRDVPHLQLAAAYSALGRMQEAHAAAAEVLRIDPGFRVSAWKAALPDYKDRARLKSLGRLLLDADLPE